MKLIHLFFIAAACTMVACTNDETTEIKSGSTEKPDTGLQSADCYAGNSGKDTVQLSVKRTGDQVTGELSYRFHEKDANEGTIEGWMKGDTLIADYTFVSEGIRSVRQVAFLKKEDGFSEGYASSIEKDRKLLFSDLHELTFGQGFRLLKIACKK